MSRQVSTSANRSYGVLRVTRVWGTSRATLYRHRRCDETGRRHRPGPRGPMPDEALVDAIRRLLADSPFHGEGHRKVSARLRFAGIRTSKRRVLRLMRAHDLLAPGRVGRPHGPKAHDGTIRTERVDEMWGTDLTATPAGEGQAAIFVTVDHSSADARASMPPASARLEALEPCRRACGRFGAFARVSPMARAAPRQAASSSPMTIRASSASSASRAGPPSCVPPRATAVPNGSSGP